MRKHGPTKGLNEADKLCRSSIGYTVPSIITTGHVNGRQPFEITRPYMEHIRPPRLFQVEEHEEPEIEVLNAWVALAKRRFMRKLDREMANAQESSPVGAGTPSSPSFTGVRTVMDDEWCVMKGTSESDEGM